eukprot:INCI9413.2.p1 GENE.INCI9413.2~~INCI9413.2.p1  ORF type:complete len:617 (+),score=97.97 INCI9413.2:136-1986(+)
MKISRMCLVANIGVVVFLMCLGFFMDMWRTSTANQATTEFLPYVKAVNPHDPLVAAFLNESAHRFASPGFSGRHFEVQLVANIKSGSTWLSLLLSHFFTRLYAPPSEAGALVARASAASAHGSQVVGVVAAGAGIVDPPLTSLRGDRPGSGHSMGGSEFAPEACDATEFEMANNAAIQHGHCCVLFFKVDNCAAVRASAGGVPPNIDSLVEAPNAPVEQEAWPANLRKRLPPDLKERVESTPEQRRRKVRTASVAGALAGGFPVFSSDKHLQYARDCKYRASQGTVDCARDVQSAVDVLAEADMDAGRNARSRRYVVLIRDPRDIAVSWFYYRCFKTYNSQLNRLAKIRHPGRLAKARADFEAAYHICDAMRADPDAVWNASVESAAQVRWNSTNTVMSGQTLESVVGQATSFYCDFLRSTQAGLDKVLVVHYEDLLTDVRGKLQEVLDFLGFTKPSATITQRAHHLLHTFRNSSAEPLDLASPGVALAQALGGAAALYDADVYTALLEGSVAASSFTSVHAVETALVGTAQSPGQSRADDVVAKAKAALAAATGRAGGEAESDREPSAAMSNPLLQRYQQTKCELICLLVACDASPVPCLVFENLQTKCLDCMCG